MIKKMLINAMDPEELRIALVEDGRLQGFFTQTAAKEQTRANIYLGVVARVEPALQAAFVDYGQPRHGFLQVGDLRAELSRTPVGEGDSMPPVEKALAKGQEILVQVVKEPVGNKGASLTTYLSLPGQVLVLTVGRQRGGVSRQIGDEAERKRLREIIGELKVPERVGIIARTASEGRSKRDLQAEARMLLRLWEDIAKRAKKAKAPVLMHQEQELAVRAVRDWLTTDLDEILVDYPEVFHKVQRFVALANPRRKSSVKHYQAKGPIFSKYDVERQLEEVYRPEVKLPTGGGIVIHPTEALVAVDVNSGKAIKGKDVEETALAVNLEAAAEVARQLRLRDLGGLIVIDFIDMRDRKAQRQVVARLKEELKRDKAKVTVGNMSRFGLVELSRQRIRPPADFGSTRACPHCGGRGLIRTPEAVGRNVLRNLQRRLAQKGEGGVKVLLHPDTHHWLTNAKRAELSRMECAAGICLELAADPDLGPEDIRVEKTEAAWPVPPAPGAPETPAQPAPAAQKPAPAPAPAGGQPAPAAKGGQGSQPAPAEGAPAEGAPAPKKRPRRRRRRPKKPAAPSQ